jgi:RNA polymerase sigma-70 factor (sigma-E family)
MHVRESQVVQLVTGHEQLDLDFHAFVKERSAGLLRTAWLLTGDRGLAEDLLQTSLAATWARRDSLRHGPALEAYVRKAMLNTISSWRRRMSFHEIPIQDFPDTIRADRGEREARIELLKALAHLPLRQRAVIALRYLEDLSEADTAIAMGCSVGTVKSHTSRALRALSQHAALKGLIDMEDLG